MTARLIQAVGRDDCPFTGLHGEGFPPETKEPIR